MKLRKFETYADYVRVQTEVNKQKLGRTWATSRDMEAVASYILSHIPDVGFGICHGVRGGWEVEALASRLPGVRVVGTEISETAAQAESVIQWDFHEVKDEWLGAVDFIYTNSWDHSYDPEHALDQWMRCIKPSGRCFIEWSRGSSERDMPTEADCFGASAEEYGEIINKRYAVESRLQIPISRLRRAIRRLRLTQTVSLGMPKEIFVCRHAEPPGAPQP